MSYYPGFDEESDADSSEPSAPPIPVPPTPVPPTPEAIQRGVQVLHHGMTSAWLGLFIGDKLQDQIPAQSLLEFAVGVRAELKPKDSLEKLLVDSALLSHFKAAQLMAEATGAGLQRADICLKAAPKFLAEFRKCVLALKEYRSPVVAKQVTVVQQQNVAQGDQQVACVVADAAAMKDLSAVAGQLKTTLADLKAPMAAIEQQPKTVDDLVFEAFLATKEVRQEMTRMEAASARQCAAQVIDRSHAAHVQSEGLAAV